MIKINSDERGRCPWCGGDPLYIAYHDLEWGRPSYDDAYLFAMLCLESMQAGLSWITVLRKRDAYYQAFDDFNAQKIAEYDDEKVASLLQNSGIIRHKGKILAIIANAKAYLKIKEKQSFSDYLWGIVTTDHQPIVNYHDDVATVPARTGLSDQLAKQLKKDGFKFIGSTTCYAYMQAVGMVNDHLNSCTYKYQKDKVL